MGLRAEAVKRVQRKQSSVPGRARPGFRWTNRWRVGAEAEAQGRRLCPHSVKGGIGAAWAVCAPHVSPHSQGKMGFGGDAYFTCRWVILETKSSASQAAVISEAKVSHKDTVGRI